MLSDSSKNWLFLNVYDTFIQFHEVTIYKIWLQIWYVFGHFKIHSNYIPVNMMRSLLTRIYFKHSSCGRGSFSLYVDIFLCKLFQINWHRKTCKLKKMEYILQKFIIKYQISDFYVAALYLSYLKMMQHIILNVYMYK